MYFGYAFLTLFASFALCLGFFALVENADLVDICVIRALFGLLCFYLCSIYILAISHISCIILRRSEVFPLRGYVLPGRVYRIGSGLTRIFSAAAE